MNVCQICGEQIIAPLITQPNAPAIGQPGRAAAEFQNIVVEFYRHMERSHKDYVQLFAITANAYRLHLVAKLIQTTDEEFELEREQERRLFYWTLAGKLEFSQIQTPANGAESVLGTP